MNTDSASLKAQPWWVKSLHSLFLQGLRISFELNSFCSHSRILLRCHPSTRGLIHQDFVAIANTTKTQLSSIPAVANIFFLPTFPVLLLIPSLIIPSASHPSKLFAQFPACGIANLRHQTRTVPSRANCGSASILLSPTWSLWTPQARRSATRSRLP